MYPDFAVFFCVITFWSVGTHPAAVPVPFQQRNAQPESFWRSPCGAIVIDPPQAPNWPKLKNLLNQISMRAEMTGSEAEQRKNQFIKNVYDDPKWEDDYRDHTHKWLPQPPKGVALQEELAKIDIETAFRKVYGYLQHYAVGLEQAALDQTFAHGGEYANLFREIQNSLRRFLCDVDQSIHLLKIRKDPDILRDVMSIDQRKLSGDHKITLRDYIILRDYIHMVRYIHKLFAYLAGHPDKRPQGVPIEITTLDDSSASLSSPQ